MTIKPMVKEVIRLLEYLSDIPETEMDDKDLQVLTDATNILNFGCECDSYNGFDCGCGKRARLRDEALDVIIKLRELI